MSKLTVAVTAYDDAEGLKYTLESLCEQTDENFEVLVLLCGASAEAEQLTAAYCAEYVGFSAVKTDRCLIPESRNLALKESDAELLLFMLEGDYLSPEFVEQIYKACGETKADILCPRLYVSGEHEPYYHSAADLLAVLPRIDRFDAALLHALNLPGRVFRRRIFDLYSLSYPAVPGFYDAALFIECVYRCDARISGVPGAVYEDGNDVSRKGFLRNGRPGTEGLKTVCGMFDSLVSAVRETLSDSAGRFDGDEYVFQETLWAYFGVLTDQFYRFFWYLSDADLSLLREQYETISAQMTKERREKISEAFRDLHFPSMYTTRTDAAALPFFSLLLDFSDYEDLPAFLTSLYTNRLPFFEVFLKESGAPHVPGNWRNTENLHVLPDEGFFTAARAKAAGVPINVRDASPLAPKILSELALTRAPKAALQYLFAAKRKKTSAKAYLKKKGALQAAQANSE